MSGYRNDVECLNELIREGYKREATLLGRADGAEAEVRSLRQQLAGAVDRLRWIESYFTGAWPDHDDCAVIWKLAKGDPGTVAKFAAREGRHAG